ncbi:MAG TPA: zf-HC2 domain-containing protein [Clostridia bacterium]|nr:zf-HC2 domain-containing protein [Clostridia bacterium]
MNPCPKNRKRIAWLAIDALEAAEAQELREHLENCAACRQYWQEIVNVTAGLSKVESGLAVQPSAAFHARLARRLKAEPALPYWKQAALDLRAVLASWRVAWSTLGVGALVVVVWLTTVRSPTIHAPQQPEHLSAIREFSQQQLPPTLAAYQKVANRSLDEFDSLLTHQASRVLPRAPIFSASSFENGADNGFW